MPVVTDYTALLSGSYWNGIEVTGAPVIVTYSFPTTLPAYDAAIDGFTAATDSSFQPFTTAEKAQAVQALGEWAAASGLVFIQVAAGEGDVNFQNVDFNTTVTTKNGASYVGAGGIGFYPFGNWDFNSYPNFTDDRDASGEIFMNTQFQAGDGTVTYGTLLHEIGHAIGLKHPTEVVTDAAADPDVVHDQVLSSDDPTRTIMATTGDGSGADATLLQLDKDAAAFIYGAAGTGGVETASASGKNAISSWSWDASTETLTQTAVTSGETIRGSSVNDIINGSGGDDRLFGLAGDDQLNGGQGNDALYGGSGTDTLTGGPGDDSYYLLSAKTTITEVAGDGYDTVYTSVSFTLPANVEELHLFGAGLTGTANDQGDTFFGDGTSGQTMIGGAGDDIYHIFSPTTIVEQANAGQDAIYATLSMTLPANVEELHLFGTGLTGTANDLDDSLFGDGISGTTLIAGTGNDYMVGGGGNDTLVAGTGIDTMYGQAGKDRFVFNSKDDAPDRAILTSINDFSEGVDKIVLSAIKASGGQDLTFVGTSGFSGTPGEVHQVASAPDTIVEGDLNGDKAADFRIYVVGTPTLQSSDFVFSATACYRAGTRIMTSEGEVAVECLAVGDSVMTVSGEARCVKWIGQRHIDCTRHPDPSLVWPVRLTEGAFGDRLPRRDLWLSPDHAVFVDDVLIPIKHLINGTTIAQMPSDDVTYYHIELARHDVLFAEGLPAESYLDTGNRWMFANGGGATLLHPGFGVPNTWSDDAVAPLAVDEARVRPVWERLAARAALLGLPISNGVFTSDPEVRLLIDGSTIRPLVSDDDRFVFVLPRRGGSGQLVSRSACPTDARPWAGDRRRLGVCVSRIVCHDKAGPSDLPIDHPALEAGWWDVEDAGNRPRRWTDGNATVPISRDAIMIEVHLAGCLPYRLDRPAPECVPREAQRGEASAPRRPARIGNMRLSA